MSAPKRRATRTIRLRTPVSPEQRNVAKAPAQNRSSEYASARETALTTQALRAKTERSAVVQAATQRVNSPGSRPYPKLNPWWEFEWDPWLGCEPKSRGCYRCYAARRLGEVAKDHPAIRMDGDRAVFTGEVYFNPRVLHKPLALQGKRVIWLGAHSDVFQPRIMKDVRRLDQVHGVIESVEHDITILTKYPENALKYYAYRGKISKNIRLGISAERQRELDERLPYLERIPATWRFISAEPLLENLEITPRLSGQKYWVVAMTEIGRGAFKAKPEWITNLRAQCETLRLPFFWETTEEDTKELVQLRINPPGGRPFYVQPRMHGKRLEK